MTASPQEPASVRCPSLGNEFDRRPVVAGAQDHATQAPVEVSTVGVVETARAIDDVLAGEGQVVHAPEYLPVGRRGEDEFGCPGVGECVER